MADVSLTYQQVLFTLIDGASVGATVSSEPLHSQALPYVALLEADVADWPVGHEITIAVHTYSSIEGPHECRTIQGKIRDAVHDTKAVELANWRFVNIRETSATTDNDPQGQTWHGTQRFSCFAERLS